MRAEVEHSHAEGPHENEGYEGHMKYGTASTMFTIRYRKSLQITAKDRIVYKGNNYDITSHAPTDEEPNPRYLEIIATRTTAVPL